MEQRESVDDILEREVKWFRRRMWAWSAVHLRDFPWRRTTDPYAIFVAEFLLQQTDAPRVVPVYEQVVGRYPTLEALADAPLADLTSLLLPLGFHFRAVRMREVARLLVNDTAGGAGTVPRVQAELLKLPGVGLYMARSICANAFGQPTAVLDTNVARILQRFFAIQPRTARPRDDVGLWDAAQRAAPRRKVSAWNLTLIDFGAAVCTARSPRCARCPLQRRCAYAAALHQANQVGITD